MPSAVPSDTSAPVYIDVDSALDADLLLGVLEVADGRLDVDPPARPLDHVGDLDPDEEISVWFDTARDFVRMLDDAFVFDGGPFDDVLAAPVESRLGRSADLPVSGLLDGDVLDADVLDLLDAQRPEHTALVYETESELSRTVGAFLERALDDGDQVGLVVTGHQRRLLAEAMPFGLLEREVRRGRITVADAHETLALFYVDGVVDAASFEHHVAVPFRTLVRGASWATVYGEMAPLLWSAGDVVGALTLERLWTDLQSELPYSLLCAYPASDVAAETDGMRDLCSSHQVVHA